MLLPVGLIASIPPAEKGGGLEEKIQLLGNIWPILVALMAAFGGYINLQNRVKNLEESDRKRNEDFKELILKVDGLKDLMSEIKGELRMRRRREDGETFHG